MGLYIPWRGLFQWLIAGISGHNCILTLSCNFLTSRCVFFPGGMRTKVRWSQETIPAISPAQTINKANLNVFQPLVLEGRWRHGSGFPSSLKAQVPPESLESADLHLLPGGANDCWVNTRPGKQTVCEKGPVEIVDLPIKHVDFPIVM